MQYLITDLFEKVILFDNQIKEGTYEQLPNNQYKVKLKLAANKYEVDSLGVETAVNIQDWIEIGVYAQDTTGKNELIHTQNFKITNQITDLEILVNDKPSKAGISPFDVLIDKNKEGDILILKEKIE